jgi:hypothetical protein
MSIPKPDDHEDVEQGCHYEARDNSSPTVDDKALRTQIMAIGGDEVEGVAVLSFRALQLYRIAVLQSELTVKQSVVMNEGKDGRGAEGKIIDDMLQNYG